ncbi:MAG: SDR family NAD(P)-dependent oxidoreductase, partial [Cyanobacteria bacterium J06598_3]
LPLDVTDNAAIKQVVEAVLTTENRIDLLINNAGFGQFGPLMDIEETHLQQQFATNVFAPIAMVQAVAPVMRSQSSGTIINIGSVSGTVTTPFAGAYCASKAALHSLSEALRMELAPFGIQVITVQPGAIRSSFGQAAEKSVSDLLTPDSWYAPLQENIQARTTLSQLNATPAEAFATQLACQLMQANPPNIIRLGKKSRWLPLLKHVLPTQLMDFLLKRKFGLLSLKDSRDSATDR